MFERFNFDTKCKKSIGYVKTVDVNIQSLIQNAKQSGQLAEILKQSWKFEEAPKIGNVKHYMHESKVRKEQSVKIETTNHHEIVGSEINSRSNSSMVELQNVNNINHQNGEGLKDNLFLALMIAPVSSSTNTNTPGENIHNTDSDSDDNVTIGVANNKMDDGDVVHQMNLIKDADNSTQGNAEIDYNQSFRE